MPSKLPQLNVRLHQEDIDRVNEIVGVLAVERDDPHVSQADAVRLALRELHRRLCPKKETVGANGET